MKHFIAGLLLGPLLLVALAVCLLVGGCSGSAAPATDTTGATPTGKTLTVKITGDTPVAFLATKRGDGAALTEDIKLPHEKVFNVRAGDHFDLGASVKNGAIDKIQSNITIELLLDGTPVLTAKEGQEMPGVTHAVYTVPES